MMKLFSKKFNLILIAGFLIFCFTLFQVVLAVDYGFLGNQKYAWGENVGWLNFNPTHSEVLVNEDCLKGFIWAENIGWVKVGDSSCAGGDCCQTGIAYGYENDSDSVDNDGDGVADDWGINNDGDGNLSGYAWGENVGWLNFGPTDSQVVINTSTGEFSGYAWGENVGWMSFSHNQTSYTPITDWRPAVAPDFSISALPNTIKAPETGTSETSVITITSLNSFNSATTLSVISGLPSGATADFNPNPVTPPADSTVNSDFTIDTSSVTPGLYILIVQGQSGATTHTTNITLEVPNLLVGLAADPSSGTAPLNNVDLTADVSGSATGTIDYKLDCNVTGSPGSLVPSGGTWDYIFDSSSDDPKTVVDACDYSSEGTYTAGVRAERDVANPIEDKVTVTVGSASSTSASLTSFSFNTTMADNALSQLKWTEDLPSGTDIKFQIRTSPNNSSWTGWMGPGGNGASYFQSSGCSKNGQNVTCNIPAGIAIGDGTNDQWVQYKVWLETTSAETSILYDVTLNYGN